MRNILLMTGVESKCQKLKCQKLKCQKLKCQKLKCHACLVVIVVVVVLVLVGVGDHVAHNIEGQDCKGQKVVRVEAEFALATRTIDTYDFFGKTVFQNI